MMHLSFPLLYLKSIKIHYLNWVWYHFTHWKDPICTFWRSLTQEACLRWRFWVIFFSSTSSSPIRVISTVAEKSINDYKSLYESILISSMQSLIDPSSSSGWQHWDDFSINHYSSFYFKYKWPAGGIFILIRCFINIFFRNYVSYSE